MACRKAGRRSAPISRLLRQHDWRSPRLARQARSRLAMTGKGLFQHAPAGGTITHVETSPPRAGTGVLTYAHYQLKRGTRHVTVRTVMCAPSLGHTRTPDQVGGRQCAAHQLINYESVQPSQTTHSRVVGYHLDPTVSHAIPIARLSSRRVGRGNIQSPQARLTR